MAHGPLLMLIHSATNSSALSDTQRRLFYDNEARRLQQLLIQCFPSSEDATILPYHNISYVLTQQDADAIEWHCKRLGFKQCRIVATTVNGEEFKENIDVSWIHMRTSLWEKT